ncbi:2-hydroxyhepta-2,4-diene-1,7-dioate isomerase [Mycobacterium avium subsp. hominissuis 10-5606]|nr:2-hydroxyhepta-2,4-diene-1,7-dioate isomerase [Mycobacterium avium subsp. hominissuis 10-5606]
MRLATFHVAGPTGPVTRLGLLAGDLGSADTLVDLNAAYAHLITDRMSLERVEPMADVVVPPDMVAFLGNGRVRTHVLDEIRSAQGELVAAERNALGQRLAYRLDEVQLLAPLPRPSSLRDCSAFEEHVRNCSGPRGVPDQWYRHPSYYKGNPFSVVGTGVPVLRPAGETRMDYELEFAVVIGSPGRNIAMADADQHIAGYTVFNDVSCRDIQLAEMKTFLGPAKGKDFDGGNVLGPYLVTPEDFDPAAANAMIARVDGVEWSRGSTDTSHYSVAEIISYVSRDETLRAGDVIGVGTVGGGCGLELGRFPEMGQTVELEVAGLGVLRNRFVDTEQPSGREAMWADSMAKSP